MTSPAPHESGWIKAVQRRPTAKQQGWEAGQFCLASTSHPEPTLTNPANPMNSEAGWCREVGLDWHWSARRRGGRRCRSRLWSAFIRSRRLISDQRQCEFCDNIQSIRTEVLS